VYVEGMPGSRRLSRSTSWMRVAGGNRILLWPAALELGIDVQRVLLLGLLKIIDIEICHVVVVEFQRGPKCGFLIDTVSPMLHSLLALHFM
jgi:hypothetical protein